MIDASNSRTTDLAIIVPVHNRLALAVPVFEALKAESDRDGQARVIVVDQGSTDGVDRLAAECGFTVLRSTEPSAGGLRNVGVACGQEPLLYFVDSDVLVSSGQLQRVRSRLTEHPNDVVGCLYCLPAQPVWSERTWDGLTVELDDGTREWLNAGNLAVSRELFVAVGGFDSSLTSGEDTEFCARVRKAGREVRQFRDLAAAHLGNPKSLRQFFNKQIWHGQGAQLSNRNSLAALAHVALLLGGAGLVVWDVRHGRAWGALAAFLLASLVPMTAILAVHRRGRRSSILPSLALLNTYFVARAVALFYRSNRQR